MHADVALAAEAEPVAAAAAAAAGALLEGAHTPGVPLMLLWHSLGAQQTAVAAVRYIPLAFYQ